MYNLVKGRLIAIRMALLIAALLLITIGIASIYAVGHPAQTASAPDKSLENCWIKQLNFAAIALVGFIAINLVNYRRYGPITYWVFAITLIILTILLTDKFFNFKFVPLINNSRRWLRLGTASTYIQLQPSEFCKLIYIFTMAWYLRYRSNYRSLKNLAGPFALTLLPMLLILLEPDLGTVLLMMPILFSMLFVAGARVRHLLIIAGLALLLSPLLWWQMNPYQRIRISSVLLQNEKLQKIAENHPKVGKILVGTNFTRRKWENNWGYHLIRSKYAVASGSLNGYGFRQGPFIKYNFLPERHNDFIFATIAQQWGFWGALALLGLYSVILICGVEIAANNTDPFGRLLAVGIVAMFAIEIVVNIAMTIGLMPITGLTLPLVSYGGSSLVVSVTAIGVLNNIGRCRPFSLAAKK